MALQVTVGGTTYTIDEDQFKLSPKLAERWRCQIYIWDYTGTVFFSYLQKVTVTDPVLGRLFTGYVAADVQDKTNTYPDPTTLHQLDCFDPRRLAENRTSNRQYTTPTFAGKIAADMISDVMSAEGIIANYATQFVTTAADWNTGTDTNVLGTSNVGDGDLELLDSSSVRASYMKSADWNAGVFSNLVANAGGDVSLIGSTRNWQDGKKIGQSLYGNGNPTDSVSPAGTYNLSCTKSSEARSKFDFAGTWASATVEEDFYQGGDIPAQGPFWLTTGFTNADTSYGYAVEIKSGQLQIWVGQNGGGGSASSLGTYTFSPKLAVGWYRMRVVFGGGSHSVYLNGSLILSVSDSTWTSAGFVGHRNRNLESSVTVTDNIQNFGVMQAKSGTWTGPSTSIGGITTIASSIITWDTSLSQGGTILVQTSTDGGTTYHTASNGGPIYGLAKGSSGSGKNVRVKVTLSTTTTATMPDIRNLQWAVLGGYVASGTRTTLPLAIDYMDRANQSGLGTADDGQTYTKVGTGTDAISGNEATVTNTTGDVYEKLGSKSASDSEDSTRFSLSASTMKAGVMLRYVDANNWYALFATTTTLSIVKSANGTQTTLATATVALLTATYYRMRLRAVGLFPVRLSGRTWVDGTAEPTGAFAVTATDY